MIDQLLQAHYQLPYPDGFRIQLANVDLEMLDAEVAGLASSFVEQGRLTAHQLPILRGCLAEAERILPLLDGPAREYFFGLRDLAAEVLKQSGASAV